MSKWRHFLPEIILLNMRWYCRYPLSYRNLNKTVNAIKNKGGGAIAVQANLSHTDEVTKLFDAAQQQFGSLDILVSDAGTGVGGPVAETDEEAFEKVFGLNVKGTFSV